MAGGRKCIKNVPAYGAEIDARSPADDEIQLLADTMMEEKAVGIHAAASLPINPSHNAIALGDY